MATTDIYHITGGLKGRPAVMFLGGNVDDYLQVNAHAVARVAADDTVGTYSAWINVPDITGTYCIICSGDDNVVEFLEMNVEAGKITVRCTDATTPQYVSTTDNVVLTPHRWHHVMAVQRADNSGIYFYIDGALVPSTNVTTTSLDTWFSALNGIDTCRIGGANKVGDSSVTNEFKGAISAVKYWNKALTAEEAMLDYQGVALSDDSTYLQLNMTMNEDYVDDGLGADNGTAVGDILLSNNYCEFTSRLRYTTGVPVVADTLVCFATSDTGHAIVIQAA